MSETVNAKVIRLLKDGSEDIKAELRLLIQSALVLKGCKKSNMFFVRDEELLILADLAVRTRLHLVFIYRKTELLDYLNSEEVSTLLREYGYEGERLEGFFSKLRKRMSGFYKRAELFPHEIGLFLCYPLCDIKGFVKNGGQNFLFSGYWKVYDDLEATLKLFADFDRARERAVSEWLAGRTLYEIAA